MLPNGVEGFVAQVMLNLAGVVQRGFLADSKAHEQLAEDGMAFVDVGSDAPAFFSQIDMVILVDGYKPAFAHLPQDDGHRRTGIGEVRADVDSVNLILLLRKDIDGFQIVFGGFLNSQILSPRFLRNIVLF